MAVGFSVGFFWYQIGSGDFLHSFFSTVAYNLERKRWGSNYPVVMNELYQGKLESEKINDAINEVKDIQVQLRRYAPNQVVWDIDDLSKQPP